MFNDEAMELQDSMAGEDFLPGSPFAAEMVTASPYANPHFLNPTRQPPKSSPQKNKNLFLPGNNELENMVFYSPAAPLSLGGGQLLGKDSLDLNNTRSPAGGLFLTDDLDTLPVGSPKMTPTLRANPTTINLNKTNPTNNNNNNNKYPTPTTTGIHSNNNLVTTPTDGKDTLKVFDLNKRTISPTTTKTLGHAGKNTNTPPTLDPTQRATVNITPRRRASSDILKHNNSGTTPPLIPTTNNNNNNNSTTPVLPPVRRTSAPISRSGGGVDPLTTTRPPISPKLNENNHHTNNNNNNNNKNTKPVDNRMFLADEVLVTTTGHPPRRTIPTPTTQTPVVSLFNARQPAPHKDNNKGSAAPVPAPPSAKTAAPPSPEHRVSGGAGTPSTATPSSHHTNGQLLNPARPPQSKTNLNNNNNNGVPSPAALVNNLSNNSSGNYSSRGGSDVYVNKGKVLAKPATPLMNQRTGNKINPASPTLKHPGGGAGAGAGSPLKSTTTTAATTPRSPTTVNYNNNNNNNNNTSTNRFAPPTPRSVNSAGTTKNNTPRSVTPASITTDKKPPMRRTSSPTSNNNNKVDPLAEDLLMPSPSPKSVPLQLENTVAYRSAHPLPSSHPTESGLIDLSSPPSLTATRVGSPIRAPSHPNNNNNQNNNKIKEEEALKRRQVPVTHPPEKPANQWKVSKGFIPISEALQRTAKTNNSSNKDAVASPSKPNLNNNNNTKTLVPFTIPRSGSFVNSEGPRSIDGRELPSTTGSVLSHRPSIPSSTATINDTNNNNNIMLGHSSRRNSASSAVEVKQRRAPQDKAVEEFNRRAREREANRNKSIKFLLFDRKSNRTSTSPIPTGKPHHNNNKHHNNNNNNNEEEGTMNAISPGETLKVTTNSNTGNYNNGLRSPKTKIAVFSYEDQLKYPPKNLREDLINVNTRRSSNSNNNNNNNNNGSDSNASSGRDEEYYFNYSLPAGIMMTSVETNQINTDPAQLYSLGDIYA